MLFRCWVQHLSSTACFPWLLSTEHSIWQVLSTVFDKYWVQYLSSTACFLSTEHNIGQVLSRVFVKYWAQYLLGTEHSICQVLSTVFIKYRVQFLSSTQHFSSTEYSFCQALSTVFVKYWAQYLSSTEHSICQVLSTIFVKYWVFVSPNVQCFSYCLVAPSLFPALEHISNTCYNDTTAFPDLREMVLNTSSPHVPTLVPTTDMRAKTTDIITVLRLVGE